MTVYRRILCLAAALCLMLTLIPSATGTLPGARAEGERFGVTLDKVNVRYGPSTGDKIAFRLEADFLILLNSFWIFLRPSFQMFL